MSNPIFAALALASTAAFGADLAIYHQSATGQSPSTQPKPYLRVVNTSAANYDLAKHSVSWDLYDAGIGAESLVADCWWVSKGTCSDYGFAATSVPTEDLGARRRNLRVTIALPSVVLKAGETIEIQWGYHDRNWTRTFVETDDWSFTSANGAWNLDANVGLDDALKAPPAMLWKGALPALPAVADAKLGQVVKVGGSAYVLSTLGWELVSDVLVGPAGPIGPQGLQGPVGPVGETGEVGPVGPAGSQGIAGVPGIAGPQGDIGPAGPQGAIGPVGETGPQGAQGPKGETGDAGIAGPVGPQGPQGLQGVPGPQGPMQDLTTINAAIAALQADNATLKAQVASLQSLLRHFSRVEDTVFITHANLKILNGTGNMQSANGLGNLVVGYSDDPYQVKYSTGSHNIAIGGNNRFTSWGSFLTGHHNNVSAPYAASIGGEYVTVNGVFGVSLSNVGGMLNGAHSAILGGEANSTSGNFATAVGGRGNGAVGAHSVVVGGLGNGAVGEESVILGGFSNHVDDVAFRSIVVGGEYNTISSNLGMTVNGSHTNLSGNGGTTVGGPIPGQGALWAQSQNAVWIPTLIHQP